MTREESFIEGLVSDYAKAGWKTVNPVEGRRELGFTPDVLLERGDERLVVDVKHQGYRESRALNSIRELVQSRQGWRFEIKVIPRSWEVDKGNPVPEDVDRRIELSERLLEDGDSKESFILAWTALEALLRRQTPASADPNGGSPGSLMRKAFENGVITDDQLRSLEVDLHARNRLVHGIASDLSNERAAGLLKLIRSIALENAA